MDDAHKKWEKSIEGILYDLNIIGIGNIIDDKYSILIAETLQKLPKNVREKVLEKTLFVMTSAYGTVCELHLPVLQNTKVIKQYFIILNFALMEKEGKTVSDMMDTVAHEIGHFILGHKVSMDDPDGERDADDLAEKWGFNRAYESYKQFEKIK